jgi:hypothetical protein
MRQMAAEVIFWISLDNRSWRGTSLEGIHLILTENSSMRIRPVLRDLALVCVAVSIGWWARNADRPVLAQHSNSSWRGSSSSSDADLAFQFIGVGPSAAMAVYNSANRTVYVYSEVGKGNASVDCTYSFTIANPGAPIRRGNCPVGELAPQR